MLELGFQNCYLLNPGFHLAHARNRRPTLSRVAKDHSIFGEAIQGDDFDLQREPLGSASAISPISCVLLGRISCATKAAFASFSDVCCTWKAARSGTTVFSAKQPAAARRSRLVSSSHWPITPPDARFERQAG